VTVPTMVPSTTDEQLSIHSCHWPSKNCDMRPRGDQLLDSLASASHESPFVAVGVHKQGPALMPCSATNMFCTESSLLRSEYFSSKRLAFRRAPACTLMYLATLRVGRIEAGSRDRTYFKASISFNANLVSLTPASGNDCDLY